MKKRIKAREGKIREWVMKSARKYIKKHWPATEKPENRIKFSR